ncbi:hypothetical protein BDK51DRAFT_27363, partial [Blyttiomyces helicus]
MPHPDSTYALSYLSLDDTDVSSSLLDEDYFFLPLPDKPKNADLKNTFEHMMLRRLLRKQKGTYSQNPLIRRTVSHILFVCSASLFQANAPTGDLKWWGVVATIVGSSIVVVLFYVRIPRVAHVFIAASLTNSLVLAFSNLASDASQDRIRHRSSLALTILACTVTVISLTFWMWYFVALPALIRAGKIGMSYWNVRQVPGSAGELIYSGFDPRSMLASRWRKHRCRYIGEVDESHRPHGFGTWQDDSVTGESLRGWWEHGIPCAPFTSREMGTGTSFHAARIGIARSAATPWNVEAQNPVTRDGPMEFGVAAVEVCVSGKFYKALPKVEIIDKWEEREDGVEWCFEKLALLDNSSDDTISIKTIASTAMPLIPTQPRQAPPSLLDIPKRVAPSSPSFTEAIVYVHGYSSTCSDAVCTLGQFLGLCSLPPHMAPMVFNWSSGKLGRRALASFLLAKKTAQSPQVTDHLIGFFRALAEAGVQRVHVLAHSMGTRVVSTAAPAFRRCFRPLGQAAAAATGPQLELATLCLLNAETDYAPFVRDTFPIVRRFCTRVTMYGDVGDGALRGARLLAHNMPLGRCGHLMYRLPGIATDEEDEIKRRHDEAWRKREPGAEPRATLCWMDLDVVDTTFLP